jgi:hypothetical protein
VLSERARCTQRAFNKFNYLDSSSCGCALWRILHVQRDLSTCTPIKIEHRRAPGKRFTSFPSTIPWCLYWKRAPGAPLRPPPDLTTSNLSQNDQARILSLKTSRESKISPFCGARRQEGRKDASWRSTMALCLSGQPGLACGAREALEDINTIDHIQIPN